MGALHVKALCEYIDASPSAFHAVDAAVAALSAAGATRLDERDRWILEPGKAYYIVRDSAALVSFRIGKKKPVDSGFAIMGAHTDAPGLRARLEKSVEARGAGRVPVEAYGGPIHSTWMDRPLSAAGRVVVRTPSGAESRLFNFARPMAVIPNLAIHFNREMNKGVEYSLGATLLPLVAARGSGGSQTDGPGTEQDSVPATDAVASPGSTAAGHAVRSWLQRAIAAELHIAPDDILAADTGFVDATPSLVFGDDDEILSAPRIDNLEGCHAILTAFCAVPGGDHTQVVALFDNEEIGSMTPRGADSSLLRDVLSRIVAVTCGSDPEAIHRALARSFSVSVDGAQGWHPSYADKFDEAYAPVLNGGPAVKSSANVRYATDPTGEVAFMRCCESAGVPCQRFRMKPDIAPGTTIGPISSALLGVRTVDVGVPMLAMHSARETAGAYDHDYMIAALRAFMQLGPAVADW